MNGIQESSSNIQTPVDATRVFEWDQDDGQLCEREFVGTERQAGGFTVTIEGQQRETGMCRRLVAVWRSSRNDHQLPVQAARQLAAAISAAADEIDALR